MYPSRTNHSPGDYGRTPPWRVRNHEGGCESRHYLNRRYTSFNAGHLSLGTTGCPVGLKEFPHVRRLQLMDVDVTDHASPVANASRSCPRVPRVIKPLPQLRPRTASVGKAKMLRNYDTSPPPRRPLHESQAIVLREVIGFLVESEPLRNVAEVSRYLEMMASKHESHGCVMASICYASPMEILTKARRKSLYTHAPNLRNTSANASTAVCRGPRVWFHSAHIPTSSRKCLGQHPNPYRETTPGS